MSTVDADRLRDAQGAECLDVVLPANFDDRAGATVFVQPDRCCHLIAPADIRWTAGAVLNLAYRVGGRISTWDDVPPQMAADLDDAVTFVLAWASGAAA